MPKTRIYLSVLLLLFCLLGGRSYAQRQMEALGRGVVAFRTSSTQVYVGWRMLGDDPRSIGFNLYRQTGSGTAVKINGATPLTASTNYLDTPGSSALTGEVSYYVRPVIDGVEGAPSEAFTLQANAVSGRQFLSLPLATAYPNPDSTYPYDVKFAWVGDFDGDGEYDFLVDRLSTNPTAEKQFLEAYKRDGTFLWRMDMGANSVNQYAYEPGSSAISIGDSDNLTVYDLDGDGKAEVAVRTANGVTVTNASGEVVATITAASNSTQFVSIIDGMTGVEKARADLPNAWAQHGTLTNKCAIAYLDGQRPSVLFYGYNRANSGEFYRMFTTYDYRDGVLSQRWSLPQDQRVLPGAEGHQIRVADVDNDGRDEICDIGHVIDDDGTQLFHTELSHGDRFHIADIDPERPGLETYAIQQNNPTLLATAYYGSDTGEMIRRWYSTSVVDVGRGIAVDITAAWFGYEMYSTQPGIYNAKAEQIYENNVWAPEGLWWDADLGREFIDGAGSGALNPVINKFNPATGVSDRVKSLYSDAGSYSIHQAYGGRPAFWGDILGDWREELVFVTSDYTALRIYSTTNVATNRLYTLMQNPQYRCQATTKGYVQASYVDYYLGYDMPEPPPPPMVKADLAWQGGAAGVWNASTANWSKSGAASAFASGDSVRFDIGSGTSSTVALSGQLSPKAVTVYSPYDYAFDGSSGSLTGAMTLTKVGEGSLSLTGDHDYNGDTLIWDGALQIDGSLTSSPVTVWGGTWGGAHAKGLTGGRLAGTGSIENSVTLKYRGAITPGDGMNAPGTLNVSSLAATDGSALAFDLSGDVGATNDKLVVAGNLSLSGTVHIYINPMSGKLSPGTYELATYGGSLTGSKSNLSVTVPEGTPYDVTVGGGSLNLIIKQIRDAADITWKGGLNVNVWDLANTANWLYNGSSDTYVTGDSVTFDDTGLSNPVVNLNITAPVGGVTVNSSGNYTIQGDGSISGNGGLIKTGTGTLTLKTTNAYAGPTNVQGGVLAVDNLNDGGVASSIGASDSSASNLVINGATLRLVGLQTNTNRNVTIGASGATFDIPNASVSWQQAGVLSGSGSLTKTGAGTLILAAANTHTGGTILESGMLALASDTANASAMGSGGLTLKGGTLRMYNNLGSYNSISWPITVPEGASARFEADGRCDIYSTLSGSGTFVFHTPYVRTSLYGNWSAFRGTIDVVSDSDGGDFRLMNSSGLPSSLVHLSDNTYTYYNVSLSSNRTFPIGALSGSSGATISGPITAGRTLTWQVGARGDDTTFDGVIKDGSGLSALTKMGAGTLTLNGANTYTGATTVSGGQLMLSGSLSGSNVSVSTGAGLGGLGSVTGNVTFGSGSAALVSPTGALAINGNLSLSGTVSVMPVPGEEFQEGSYSIFTYTGSLSGASALHWSGAGFKATFDTSVPGRVTMILSDTSEPPTDLVAMPGDQSVVLQWTPSSTAVSYSVLRALASDAGNYTEVASGLAGTSYTDEGLSNGTSYYYVVSALSVDGGSGDTAPVLVSVGPSIPYAHWRLDETSGTLASDSSGNNRNATLFNTPSWTAGRVDNGLAFASGSSEYASLPSGIVSTLHDFTLSAWVQLSSQGGWARIWDLGTGTNNYMFLTPSYGSSGVMRFAIRTPSQSELVIDSAIPTPVGSWFHVTVTLSGSIGTLYIDGAAVGINSGMTLTPADLGTTTQNYFARSQFSADPYLNGVLDDVRIYTRALSSDEVATLAAPPVAPSGFAATPGAGQVALSWTTTAGADAYAVQRSTSPTNSFTYLATHLDAANYLDVDVTPGVTYYYALTAFNGLAEGSRSAIVSAIPNSVYTLLQSWRQAHFGTVEPTGSAANNADPDGDGLVNLIEYALGTDPMAWSGAGAPTISQATNKLALHFHTIADPVLIYTVQASVDLHGWSDVWTQTGEANVDKDVTVSDTVSINETPRRFLRLQVSVP